MNTPTPFDLGTSVIGNFCLPCTVLTVSKSGHKITVLQGGMLVRSWGAVEVCAPVANDTDDSLEVVAYRNRYGYRGADGGRIYFDRWQASR